MNKLRFRVVTGVLLALTILAFAKSLLQPFVPPNPANHMASQTGEFYRQAAHEEVDWKVFDDRVFLEARQLQKPILLVIGSPASTTGRWLDTTQFTIEENVQFLRRNFVCTRVDALQSPQWKSCFYPIERLRLGFLPDLQIWVLDPSGQVLSFIGESDANDSLAWTVMINKLVEARSLFEKVQSRSEDVPNIQARDREMLILGAGLGNPPYADYSARLGSMVSERLGGTPYLGMQRLTPLAWRYLGEVGMDAALKAALDPFLASSQFDPIEGGAYGLTRQTDRPRVNLNKITVQNAELAELLAFSAQHLQRPVYRWFAEKTIDYVLASTNEDGMFYACESEEPKDWDRSSRSSFSPRKLRAFTLPQERDWLRTNLGLMVETNQQMLPRICNLSAFENNQSEVCQKLGTLGQHMGNKREQDGAALLDVNGQTAACLLRAARCLGDDAKTNRLLDMVDAMEGEFVTENDVTHYAGSAGATSTYLGDYLAYADCQLEAFLSSGHIAYIEHGVAVLERALEVYGNGTPGYFVNGTARYGALSPQAIDVPQIADDGGEATSAQVIRLCLNYGRLLSPSPRGKRLVSTACQTMGLFCSLPASMDPPCRETPNNTNRSRPACVADWPSIGGYFRASAAVSDPRCAFAVGPHAQELSTALYQRRPARLISPAIGPVRVALRGKKPGIYLLDRSMTKLEGPFTVDEAAARLPATFDVGVPTVQ